MTPAGHEPDVLARLARRLCRAVMHEVAAVPPRGPDAAVRTAICRAVASLGNPPAPSDEAAPMEAELSAWMATARRLAALPGTRAGDSE